MPAVVVLLVATARDGVALVRVVCHVVVLFGNTLVEPAVVAPLEHVEVSHGLLPAAAVLLERYRCGCAYLGGGVLCVDGVEGVLDLVVEDVLGVLNELRVRIGGVDVHVVGVVRGTGGASLDGGGAHGVFRVAVNGSVTLRADLIDKAVHRDVLLAVGRDVQRVSDIQRVGLVAVVVGVGVPVHHHEVLFVRILLGDAARRHLALGEDVGRVAARTLVASGGHHAGVHLGAQAVGDGPHGAALGVGLDVGVPVAGLA